jgi:curli biogenesis system outer membrane secretion channel CsgG
MVLSLRSRLIAACVMLSAVVSSPAYSQKVLAEGIKDLATQIAASASKEKKQKIAVLPFRELDGKPTILGSFISEELVTDLIGAGEFDIVERAMLDRLLGEIKLGQTGVIDPETAKKVGKVASVDAIVTGSITDLQSYVALNCRLIDTQTGRVFAAAQTRIVKDDDVRKIMGAALPGSQDGVKPTPKQPEREATSTVAPEPIRVRVNDHVFELKRCTLSGTDLQCEILITNQGQDRTLYLFPSNARLVDEEGTQYDAISLTLGGGAHVPMMVFGNNKPPAASHLATGVPVKAVLSFEGIPSGTKRVALIEIQETRGGLYGGRGLVAQFRNVPLTRP